MIRLQDLRKEEIIKLARTKCVHGHSLLEHPSCIDKGFRDEKRGFLDIETSNLAATFGYAFSYCIKEEGGKIYGRAITREEVLKGIFDKELMKDCVKDLLRFDRIITYYGTKFDIPFLRTRCLLYGIEFPFFGLIKHTDLYYTIKHKFKLHRSRLETACDFFGIPSKAHKLHPEAWQKAMAGDVKSLNYIFEHNKEDVISTEMLYKKTEGYAKTNNKSI